MKMPSSRLNWFIFIASTSLLFGKTFVNSLIVSSANSAVTDNEEVDGREQTVYACSGSPLVLRCGENETNHVEQRNGFGFDQRLSSSSTKSYVIEVTRANYGRFSIALCNEEGRTDWSVNCFEPKTKKIITDRCNNKNHCEISASDYDFGPDPCPDTERYLEAHYICVQRKSYVTTDKPLPPWMNSKSLSNKQSLVDLNNKRKPISRRVPITAPPTIATSAALETEATSVFVTTNKPITPNFLDKESVISAPVFYENHSKTNIAYKENHHVKNSSSSANKNVHVINASNLEKTISNNLEKTSSALRRCFKTNARGLIWQETHYGSKPSQQCPNNPTSFAQWHCKEKNGKGFWANDWPDLSRCHSNWIQALMKTEDVKLVQHGQKILALTDKVYDILRSNNRELFGGDLPSILDLIQSHIQSWIINIQNENKKHLENRYHTPELSKIEDWKSSLKKLSSILSNLINERSIDAWKDLVGNKNRHKATVEKFMEVSENLGALISLMMTGKERGPFSDTKKDFGDKGQKIIKEGEVSPFLRKGNMFTISTSRIENSLATNVATSNLCLYVWKFKHKGSEMFDGIVPNQRTHKLNSLRSAESTPQDRKLNLNRNIKINQRRRDQNSSSYLRSANILIRFPSHNGDHDSLGKHKNDLDSKQHFVYSSQNSRNLDFSQNSYDEAVAATKIFTQDDNSLKNFLSLGIKISLFETSSTSSTEKTKEALGKTNLNSLIFVALRHQEPVFETLEDPNEDSNVIYGPLVLLIKAEGNMVLNEENKRIKVEIDFPTFQTSQLHQSFQNQKMKMGNMRKVLRKNINVGNSNATYDNLHKHPLTYSCVVWDTWLKSFRKDSKVCQTVSINATHTKCICSKIGRFGLMVNDYGGGKGIINYEFNGEAIIKDYNGKESRQGDGIDEKNDKNEGLATKEANQVTNNVPWQDNEIEYKGSTSFMIIIVTISSLLLVATVLGVGLLVFYCKRIKIRDKKWEEAQTHPWYRKSKNNDPDYNERLVSASLSANENNLQQNLGRGNNSSKITSGTKLEKHLNDHDSSGNYVSTLARHHKLSVDKISDFPQNGLTMSTSNTTTTLGLSAISNEPTTPLGNNHNRQSIQSCASSISTSSNHHYQSMEDDRLSSFERRSSNKPTNKKTYLQQGKLNYDDSQCSYPYQNHYEQTTIDARLHSTKAINNDLESNHSFSRYNNTSRQQTMPYLTSSSQLLPEHLRNRPDSLQHSILTSTNTDVRNQNRIPNMKMHSRTNEDGRNNDNTRTRWRWLLTRLRKSSTYSQSSSGTSSTSTSLSSATHHAAGAAHHNSHFHYNKNHYNNQANNDLFMYHQHHNDLTTGPSSSSRCTFRGGQFSYNDIDQNRQDSKNTLNYASTLRDPVNLRPSNFPPNFMFNGAKHSYNGQPDEYPSMVRMSKSTDTDLVVEATRRSRYVTDRNYHKSQELGCNADSTFMVNTNHSSPLNCLNRVPENNMEHIFDDHGMYDDYSHDDLSMQQDERMMADRKVWLQKSHNPHGTAVDNYNILPHVYHHAFPNSNSLVEGYSDSNAERSELSNSSESSSELRNEGMLKERNDHVPETTQKSFLPKSKAPQATMQEQRPFLEEINDECGMNGRNMSRKCGFTNEKETLKDRNVSVSKRQSTSRNKQMDSHKTDYKNSPVRDPISENFFCDQNESISIDEATNKCRKTKRTEKESQKVEIKDRKRKDSKTKGKRPNISKYENEIHLNPSRSKDPEILEETYDVPLDVSDIPNSNELSKQINSHDVIEQYIPQSPYVGSEGELVQQQQQWLFNRGEVLHEYEKEEARRDRTKIVDSSSVSSEQSNPSPVNVLNPDNQSNIYMEVNPR